MNRNVIEELRANGGAVGGAFADTPLVLLTTTKAKSGQSRVTPLVYFDIDDMIVIAGSYAGSPKAPAWAPSLRATPPVGV